MGLANAGKMPESSESYSAKAGMEFVYVATMPVNDCWKPKKEKHR